MKLVLVTGSSGLIGSDVRMHFHELGFFVHGVDKHRRAVFFGPQGDTRWCRQELSDKLKSFHHVGEALGHYRASPQPLRQ